VSTVLVTGATGLAGANICRQLLARGDRVRALVREGADAVPLEALGAELAIGDIAVRDDVRRAAEGCDAAIHSAAVLGGTSQDPALFEAVNLEGTIHVLDAGAEFGMRRVVALSTGTFFDLNAGVPFEEAPVAAEPGTDPYTVTKLAAFREAVARADSGQDVVTCHPGAIYGPSPVASRALAVTSFNGVLRAGLRAKLTRYLKFPVTWVYAADVAWGSIAALDKGVRGERYLLDGPPEDVISIAACCNRLCELAGVDHRLEDIEPRPDDPALEREFGPTLVAIAARQQAETHRRPHDTPTSRRLGYAPTPLDRGLAALVDWLRELAKL